MSGTPKPASPGLTPSEPSTTEVRPPRLALRLDELADALGVSRRTIERQRSAGRFPRPSLKIGKVPLWTPESIRAWIERGGHK